MALAAGLATAATALVAVPAQAASAAPSPVSDPTAYVNTLIGTGDSDTGGVGAINNFPGATVPFGMVQYSPDTPGSEAGYKATDTVSSGFSMNHASIGCKGFGDISMLPTTSGIGSTPWTAKETISHDSGEVGVPGYYSLNFPGTGVKSELTATKRVGIGHFTYPSGSTARLVVNPAAPRPSLSNTGVYGAKIDVSSDGKTVTGTLNTGAFCFKPNRYTIYFAMSFDKAASSVSSWSGTTVTAGSRSGSATSPDQGVAKAGTFLQFPAGTTDLTVKTALSYTSVDGAKANLAAEGGASFSTARSAASASWKDALKRITVASNSSDDLRTFYTSLYRSLLHPNLFDDADGKYIGFDQKIYTVPSGHHQYANYSDWDTYRSLAPLQAILFPDVASDQASSLVRDAQQSGSYPRWPIANMSSGQMTGDNVPPLISNLYAFGAKDFDTSEALKYMRNSAETGGAGTQGPSGYVERRGAAIYNQLHYAPQTTEFQGDHAIAGASSTLEYSIDDFAIGRFAGAIGQSSVAATYQQRSGWWQNLLNPSNGGAIWPRTADTGRFKDTLNGQEGFEEGNSEQYTWLVPQDTAGLIAALGGKSAVEPRLDRFVSVINAGADAKNLWMGNEPDFGVPWTYNWTGTPTKTQDLVDRIRTELFKPTVKGEPGNDDLGAQSSWYVWAALGLYPTTPGVATLAINTPIFDQATIALPGGKKLNLTAPGASGSGRLKHIAGVSLNGTASNSTAVPASLVQNGGTIAFSLTNDSSPSWGTASNSAPPSYPANSTAVAANTYPSGLATAPGGTVYSTLDLKRFAGSVGSMSISVSTPSSIRTSLPATATFDANGKSNIYYTVTHDGSSSQGSFPITITLSGGGVTKVVSAVVAVRTPGGPADVFDSVSTAPESNPGVGNFDQGSSWSRDQLASVGLAPGQAFSVGDLKGNWPISGVGEPDSVSARGQTFSAPGNPTRIRLVGAGHDGGQNSTVTLKYDNGATQDFTINLPDWVYAPSTLPSGTVIVKKMTHRNVGDGGVVYASAELAAPSGRRIASVTLQNEGSNPKTRVFALLSNASQ